jgi:excisionase family DNA binding protein
VTSPYLTKAEAADYARVSVRTIERAIKAGDLDAGGIPGRRLIRQEWVDAWLMRAQRDRNGY